MNIVLTEPLSISEEELSTYAQKLEDLGHHFHTYPTRAQSTDEWVERIKDADILMIANQPLPDEVLRSATKLQYIAIAFTGVDHINLELATSKGIKVSNAAGYSTDSVAELALGLALATYRMIPLSDQMTRTGKALGDYYHGRQIKGKTVGIIGTGTIGQATARLFLALGAKVIAYSRNKNHALEAQGVTYTSLEDLLSQSHIISLHLALTPETRQFLNRDRLELIKSDALLINCARGPIIDNQALADLLNQEKIGFAAIDVFDQEPPLNPHDPLLHSKNTLVTPHIAFSTQEAMIKRAQISFDNVINYMQGKPQNLVN